jgi:hypothetical protein
VESKFRKFMLLRKHLVVEITVLEVIKTSTWVYNLDKL